MLFVDTYLFFSVFISSLNKVPCLLFAVCSIPLIHFHLWDICFGKTTVILKLSLSRLPAVYGLRGRIYSIVTCSSEDEGMMSYTRRVSYEKVSENIIICFWRIGIQGNCYKHQEKTTPQICLMIGSLFDCFSPPLPFFTFPPSSLWGSLGKLRLTSAPVLSIHSGKSW